MRLTRKEIRERRRRTQEELKAYAKTHSEEEFKRHVRARYHPSGRPSRGGANRSSNVKREVRLRVTRFEQCLECGGVTEDVMKLTTLFPVCRCGPLLSTLTPPPPVT